MAGAGVEGGGGCWREGGREGQRGVWFWVFLNVLGVFSRVTLDEECKRIVLNRVARELARSKLEFELCQQIELLNESSSSLTYETRNLSSLIELNQASHI